jgi:cytochrome P450
VPTLAELADDPHPHLAALRARSPVAWVPELAAYLVTGWAAAVDVLRDPVTFTVDDPRFSTARVVGPSMLSTDGTEHSRHRDPFAPPFRPGTLADRFGAFVDVIVRRCLDELQAGGSTGELRSGLAGPLAAATMLHGLGLDAGGDAVDGGELLGWYRAIVESVSVTATGRPVTAEGAAAMSALDGALRRHLGTGSTTSLLAASRDGAGLEVGEVVSNAAVIMFGGIETTEGMVLNAAWHLLSDPDRFAAVRDDPGLVPGAVEESLRLEPAAAVVDRYATRDVTVAGTEIAAGAQVTVSLAGANRDPAEFADPDRFVIARPRRRHHLAFATGPHTCIGMDLARLEVVTAVTALADRFPRLRLAAGAPAPSGLVFRKPERLPVRWD